MRSAAHSETDPMTDPTHDAPLILGEHTLSSRLLVGTGKYASFEETAAALELSGTDCVTVAVRRVNLDESKGPSLLEYIDRDRYVILPNTAGCFDVESAVRTSVLSRDLLGTKLVKLEVLGDKTTLLPDPVGTLEATEELVKQGFDVMVYCSDDPRMCVRLAELGATAVMPAGSPIGSGQGVLNPNAIRIILELVDACPIIVDAGVGKASDVCAAFELGVEGIRRAPRRGLLLSEHEKFVLLHEVIILVPRARRVGVRRPRRDVAHGAIRLARLRRSRKLAGDVTLVQTDGALARDERLFQSSSYPILSFPILSFPILFEGNPRRRRRRRRRPFGPRVVTDSAGDARPSPRRGVVERRQIRVGAHRVVNAVAFQRRPSQRRDRLPFPFRENVHRARGRAGGRAWIVLIPSAGRRVVTQEQVDTLLLVRVRVRVGVESPGGREQLGAAAGDAVHDARHRAGWTDAAAVPRHLRLAVRLTAAVLHGEDVAHRPVHGHQRRREWGVRADDVAVDDPQAFELASERGETPRELRHVGPVQAVHAVRPEDAALARERESLRVVEGGDARRRRGKQPRVGPRARSGRGRARTTSIHGGIEGESGEMGAGAGVAAIRKKR